MKYVIGQEVKGTQSDPSDRGEIVDIQATKRSGLILWVEHYRDKWIEAYKPQEVICDAIRDEGTDRRNGSRPNPEFRNMRGFRDSRRRSD